MPQEPLAQRIEAALPQTQCQRCGYDDCAAYARAIAAAQAPINQCPPGGQEGVARLARITGQAPQSLNPAHGVEAPRTLAVIDEDACIGCTLCIRACPVDAILGAAKRMHTVIAEHCTGCELCLPACPVDCIALHEASAGATGWDAWSARQARQARARYHSRRARLQGEGAAVAAQAPPAQVPVPASPPPLADLLQRARQRRMAAGPASVSPSPPAPSGKPGAAPARA